MDEHQKLSVACLAIDGFSLSTPIIQLANQLRNLGALTKLVICHIHNNRKTYLSPTYRLEGIQGLVDGLVEPGPNVVYDYKPVEADKAIQELILTTHHLRKCDLLFLGFYGAKGPHRRQEDLCSKIRKFIFQSKLSLVVVKKKHEIREKPSIIYCYDGSDIAYQGLLDMVEFSTNLKAKLIVIHSANKDTDKYTNILRHQIRQLKKMSKDIDLDFQILQAQSSPSQTLLTYLKQNESSVDFISFTKNGYRGSMTNKSFVGETACSILTGTTINLIILK